MLGGHPWRCVARLVLKSKNVFFLLKKQQISTNRRHRHPRISRGGTIPTIAQKRGTGGGTMPKFDDLTGYSFKVSPSIPRQSGPLFPVVVRTRCTTLHQLRKVLWGNAQLQCSCICSNLLRGNCAREYQWLEGLLDHCSNAHSVGG